MAITGMLRRPTEAAMQVLPRVSARGGDPEATMRTNIVPTWAPFPKDDRRPAEPRYSD